MGERKLSNLPPEMLTLIFNKLDHLSDILNCKQVNRHFYSVIHSNLEINGLHIVIKGPYYGQKVSLSPFKSDDRLGYVKFTNQPFTTLTSFTTFEHEFFNQWRSTNRFHRVRTLVIKYDKGHTLKIGQFLLLQNFLNNLKNLKVLEIHSLKLEVEDVHKYFRVKKLEVLSLVNYGSSIVCIDCASLKKFYLTWRRDIVFKHVLFVDPSKITHLALKKHLDDDVLREFVNLEYLHFVNESLSDVRNILHMCSPKLKELHFEKYVWKNELTIEGVKAAIGIKDSVRPELRMYSSNYLLEMEHIESFFKVLDNMYEQNKNSFIFKEMSTNGRLHYENLSKFVNLITQINYEPFITSPIPSNFFSKFINISSLYVDGLNKDVKEAKEIKEREENLLHFIIRLKVLSILAFEDTRLSQRFFDNLPHYAKSIAKLRILDDEKHLKNLNFSFALKFKYLIYFKTNLKSLTFNFVDSLLCRN